MPRISVIIPLFNKERSVSRAIDSVLNQSFTDFELVVVDDGSTDGGGEIVTKYQDPRIRLYSQTNLGSGAARNRGMCEAATPFVAFLDADDEWVYNFLEISFRALVKHPEAALTTALFSMNRPGNLWKGYDLVKLDDGIMEAGPDFPSSELEYLIGALHAGGSVLCRKEILQNYGGFYENRCMFAEDQYLWVQVVLNYPIYCIKRELMIYHQKDSDLALNGFRKRTVFKPVLTSPEQIRRSCPANKRMLLEKFLGVMALDDCHNFFCRETVGQIEHCLREFPGMRREWGRCISLRMKLLMHKLKLFRA